MVNIVFENRPSATIFARYTGKFCRVQVVPNTPVKDIYCLKNYKVFSGVINKQGVKTRKGLIKRAKIRALFIHEN